MSMFEELLISANTKIEAQKYLDNPQHAVLLIGNKGNGVDLLLSALAMARLGIEEVSVLENSPRALVMRPNKNGNISIDEIRNAWKFAKASGTKGRDKTKVVVIHDAHALTQEAQNSLLKLLEEPPEYLNFILSAPSTKAVLATIDSRTVKLRLTGASETEFKEFLLQKAVKSADIDKLWLVSSGEVYKAIELSQLDSGTSLSFSKELLTKEPYERLVATKGAMGDRAAALEIVKDLYYLSFLALKQSITSGKEGGAWLARLKKTEQTRYNLEANGNVRLNLTSLLVDI